LVQLFDCEQFLFTQTIPSDASALAAFLETRLESKELEDAAITKTRVNRRSTALAAKY